MDKTKVKIETYLSTVKVKSEEDRQSILDYCAERGRKIFILKKKTQIPDLPQITFEDFKKWYEKASFGDIVSLESGGIGIVKNITDDKIILHTFMKDNKFWSSEIEVPYENYRESTLEEMKLLQFELSKNNLQWNRKNGILIQKNYPLENEHVRLFILNKKVGYGIFKEIKDNRLIFYCVLMDGEPVRYSLHEDLGDYRYFQFEKWTVQDRAHFTEELERQEKEWNGFRSRIEHSDYRAPEGVPYYYISDKFTINASLEGRPRDLRRFYNGNYFRDKKDAEELLSFIQECSKVYYKRWTPDLEADNKS